MAVACGGATVHKKSVFYCIILRAPKTQSNNGDLVFEKILEMTPISVLCIGYLLSGLSATASQGH